MRDSYSLYEAKARLSALVRQVREGGRVIITVHGQPAAELRAVESEGPSLADRLARLEERGVLVRRDPAARALEPIVKRPGALRRFLDERD
jgi:prevent-host-death family protein